MSVTADMPNAVVHGIEDLRALQDRVVGPSEWREVTQEMVNRYAELTGDHQWIHVDVERARLESPYGTTIAHGNLTLSLIDGLRQNLNEWTGFLMGVNYGWNKVRFPAPVLVGARVRCYSQVVEVSEVGGGWHQVVTRVTVEAEGGEKPVCVADSVGRLLVDPAAS
jgi:acyl dehydratase